MNELDNTANRLETLRIDMVRLNQWLGLKLSTTAFQTTFNRNLIMNLETKQCPQD